MPVGLEEAVDRAEAIFFGKAVKIEWLGAREWDPAPLAVLPVSVAVTFAVEERWKGPSGDTLTVHTGAGGGDCGVRFEPGIDYVVYAELSPLSGRDVLTTTICNRGFVTARGDPRLRYEKDELDRLINRVGIPDPETARQEAEIRRRFDAYQLDLIRAREASPARGASAVDRPVEKPGPSAAAEAAIAFLCDAVIERLALLRDQALRAPKQELLDGSLYVAIDVLLLRHRLDAQTLSTLSTADLLARLLEGGWEPGVLLFGPQLGKFGPIGSEVFVDGIAPPSGRTPSRIEESQYRFERTDSGWCLDTTWRRGPDDQGEWLQIVADARGRSLDELVLEAVDGLLHFGGDTDPSGAPARASPRLWEPLAPGP
jgi:hypothetical protein